MTPFVSGMLVGALLVAPGAVLAVRWIKYGIKKLKESKAADVVEDIVSPGNDD